MRLVFPVLCVLAAVSGASVAAEPVSTLDQERMQICRHHADAEKLGGAKRRHYLGHCVTQLRVCNDIADDRRLYSVDRDEFIERCLSGK